MSYPFLKGHGTENDFVLLPDHDGSVHGDLSAERVRALCDRRAGIGGDGVLRVIRSSAYPVVEEGALGKAPVVEEGALGKAPVVEEGALRLSRNHPEDDLPEWFMDYRNADGTTAEMCGNGSRVFARHLYDEGLVPAGDPVRIATRDGVKTLRRESDDLFTVDLGVATLHGDSKVSVGDRTWPAMHVVMCNPHAVVVVDELAEAGLLYDEPAYDPAVYPDGVNIEFVVRRGPDHIAMRVHERGVGETRSCGTGSCAAAIATLGAGDDAPGRWRVDVPGGTLTVTRDDTGHVSLTGPALIVARGTTSL